jgi:histidinol-phosphate aminotransferase
VIQLGESPGAGLGENGIELPRQAVDQVISAARQLHRYPRGPLAEVTELAARYLGISSRHALLTACADEAVELALSLADRAWTVRPGSGYPSRAASARIPFLIIPLGSDWQPAPVADDLSGGDLVIFAQPGSSTGNRFDPRWIASVRAAAGHVLVDETYQAFSARASLVGEAVADEGLLVYRSLSHGLGLGGARVGCLVGGRETIGVLAGRRRFMSIDTVSLHAVAGLLSSPAALATLAAEAGGEGRYPLARAESRG